MSGPRIALIHATPVAIEPIVSAFRRLWPEARTTSLLEDSLAPDLAEAGSITQRLIERFVALAHYAHSCGADAVLFTCSAFGPAIEAAQAALPIPVLKPNEAMFNEALAAGTRIGLLATFAPSVPALKAELEQMARRRNSKIQISTLTVPSALKALHAGQVEEHDRLIALAAEEIGNCDALILGQFSMAGAAANIPQRTGRRVLTSPTSAVMQLKRVLSEKAVEPATGG
ncbi:MAG TPA: aspartate/glutamate racemase family protein [Burkholderiales bacterium]|nr:aspartate/glutamate racemase family protein [Burkholderiales bacterium]